MPDAAYGLVETRDGTIALGFASSAAEIDPCEIGVELVDNLSRYLLGDPNADFEDANQRGLPDDDAWIMRLAATVDDEDDLDATLSASTLRPEVSIELCQRDLRRSDDALARTGLDCVASDDGDLESSTSDGQWHLTSDDVDFVEIDASGRGDDVGELRVDMRLERCGLLDLALEDYLEIVEDLIEDEQEAPNDGACGFENDGECDDPSGTDLCPAGTDLNDC